jgi:hypothetical protein
MSRKPVAPHSLPEQSTGPSRRHFLRGLGVCVALPAFESLIRPTFGAQTGAATLATTATGAPIRTAFVYFPNGAIPGAWWPTGEGTNFTLSKTMEPLESHRDQFSVLRGLDHNNAFGGKDGGGDHARANSVFLTGVRLKKSASDIQAGVSIDQVLAKEIGHLTRFPSLELSCDYNRKAGACDSGYSCAYQYNISWSSAKTPMTPESNPRLVFERLFGSGSHGERAENFKRRQAEQRSVLDYVMDDARGMERRLGTSDNRKLDQYLTGLRDIEQRIDSAEKFGQTADPEIDTPAGIPASYEDHVQLMYDMLVLAFQTDSTRIATLLLAHDGSNRSFADIGISEGHHDLSHHQNRQSWVEKVAAIDLWYAGQFSKFLAKLQSVKDVDGNSLLHNSQIVYGGGNADGNRHTHTNLPIILAGAAGGATKPGRFVNFKSKPATNLFLSMADRVGLSTLDRFGDSTGRLSQL